MPRLDRDAAGMAIYVATGAGASLLAIEALGRQAITDEIPLDTVAGLHEGAALTLSNRGVPIETPEIIRRMSASNSCCSISRKSRPNAPT